MGYTKPLLVEFLDRIEKTPSCWNWLGTIDRDGYGRFMANGKLWTAHRFSFLAFRGKVDEGLTIDHLCRNRRCVNPGHLEPVSVRENTLRSPIAITAVNFRKTHCIHGHELSGDNLYMCKEKDGKRDRRNCVKCRQAASHRRYERSTQQWAP
jgi:HNH endonuclease